MLSKYKPKKLGRSPIPDRYLGLQLIIIFFMLVQSSCKRLVEAPSPVTSTNAANVYAADANAISVMTGVYANLSSGSIMLAAGKTSMSFLAGLSSDELTLYSGVTNSQFNWYYTNALTNINAGTGFWGSLYPTLFTVNSTIEGVSNSSSLTPAVQKQLLGEAKFLRALCYFYLVNLYGDVPLVTSSNYSTNAAMARTPSAQVWQQIIADLKDAKLLLSPNYLDQTLLTTTTSRVRPTKWAAEALLARCFLYNTDWTDAKAEADSVINNNASFPLAIVNSLDGVFLANSNEAIWQLQPVTTSPTNTLDAAAFIIPATGPSPVINPAYLSNNLLNTFETGDLRRTHWVDSVVSGGVTYFYPFKYKVDTANAPVTEYTMVLRLGEQYLIRAEAEANGAGNGINDAISDLNMIRHRAGLIDYPGGGNKDSVLNAIFHERRVELFTEWGHRWLDLKRSGMVDAVMDSVCTQKGGTWSSNWQWYPIPLSELQADPKLTQNNGY